jgi:threonine dehydratase
MTPGLRQVQAARRRIAGGVPVSPCRVSPLLSAELDLHLTCKLDNLLPTGSFKERGARNALLGLPPASRRRGVIAASAGNHALGLAWHGRALGVPVTVVMPRFAPLVKAATARRFGAEVVLEGDSFAAAASHARALGEARGFTYVHGFNDPAIVAGQGVCALELLEQVPDVEAVVVPVGGGGLLAGMAVALRALRPEVRLFAVEPRRAACLKAAMDAGHPVDIDVGPTLADGLAIARVGDLPFRILRDKLDGLALVDEDEIALAILKLLELEKCVAEGAGASGLAALLAGRFPELRGRRVATVVCGGNIDPSILGRVVDRGLVASSRLHRFTARISDRPGGLASLARCIAEAGASIREIVHERAFARGDVASVRVVCTVETHDAAHVATLLARLREAGVSVEE